MNQILSTKISNKSKIKKKWFKLQLYFSLLVIAIIAIFISIYVFNLYKNEQLANSLINNYRIYKLYSYDSNKNSQNSENNSLNQVFGIIEIPKLKLYYPVFSHLNEDLLKIAPCKFFRRFS